MTHVHIFDIESGWCDRCTYRDDGRLIGKGGTVFRPGPEYSETAEEEHA